ncbi:MAG: hypothetical protein HUJ27_00945 [Rhodobacteraceae bacterium]|nr:hypothetical protein [Paracoccaceae bacterium]
MSVHVFTSFTYSYLSRARVLCETLKRHHPDWTVWAVVVDEPPDGVVIDLASLGMDRVLTPRDLLGEAAPGWLFRHDLVEACTGIKGWALHHILGQPGLDKVIYLDPDIAVFDTLDPVVAHLDRHPILLTPHCLEPERDPAAIADNEIAALRHGVFNLGFLAVADRGQGRAFAAWWAERMETWCEDRPEAGLFVDQKWVNLAPCFFPDLMILRDPGCNVASWNLSQRRLSIEQDGRILVNGEPLRFFHFTKFGGPGEAMVHRYAGQGTEALELWRWYGEALRRHAEPRFPEGYWHFGTYDNGTRITREDRLTYRVRPELWQRFPDPFRTGPGRFREWLGQQSGKLAS